MPRKIDPKVMPMTSIFADERKIIKFKSPPLDKDGNAIEPDWNSDSAQLGLEIATDKLSAKVLTPETEGTGKITISYSGFRSVIFPFEYAPFVPQEFDVDLGDTESDEEPAAPPSPPTAGEGV